MSRRIAIASALGLALLAGRMAAAGDAASAGGLMDRYCLACHNYSDNAGGLALDLFDPERPYEDAQVAEKVLRKLRAGMMPPAGEKRPAAAEAQRFAARLEQRIDARATPRRDAPMLHRLNRSEYANAVRDLLGVQLDATQLLPADDASSGFDNQAGALTLSPALLEAYLSAAARLSRLAMGRDTTPTQVQYRVPEDANQNYAVEGLPFGTRGGLAVAHSFAADGRYTFKVYSVNLGNMGNFRPFGEIKGEKLLVYVDGRRIATVDWDEALGVNRRFDDEGAGQLRTIDVTVPMTAGTHRIGVTFLATQLAPGLDLNRAFERSTIETGGIPGYTFYPHIGALRIDGPLDGAPARNSASRQRILLCRPASAAEELPCARRIATSLAHRAYRGGQTEANVQTLMDFFTAARANGGFEEGIEALVQRVLVDPKFLYRIESAPPQALAGASYRVSDLDLASRLSFFLWSSIPDDTLLQLAETHRLSSPAVMKGQVERMLADPRASALTENFAGQWLGLRALASHAPVVDQFPDFDDSLRQGFRREVELLFASVLAERRSVLELLTADYTFVDERLARHYGIPGVRGSAFQRVRLTGELESRRGLLGKGAILTVSSQPGRTSPVIRGNWVLRNVLGVPAPNPPANVPALQAHPVDPTGNTQPPSLREQMTQHRSDPACRGCHKLMDPIGFALEGFDAVGHWRSEDAGHAIDAHDVLYDGSVVDGAEGVRKLLLKYQDAYLRNVTQNLLTYALGRGMDYSDMPTVRLLLRQAARDHYSLRGLVQAVALSEVFRMNRVPADALTAQVLPTAPAGGP